MKAKRSAIFLSLFIVSLLCPVHAQQPPARPVPATPPAARHPLWKVEGKSSVVYLLGSMHLLKPEDYPLPNVIEAAFTNSQIAMFEADIDELLSGETQVKFMSEGQLPDGQTLRSYLSPPTYAAFSTRVGQMAPLPGMSSLLDNFKPGVAAAMLETMAWLKLGFDPGESMDKRFYDRAKQGGKQIVPLESVDVQLGMLTGVPVVESEGLIKSTLMEIADMERSSREVVSAWKSGDSAKLDALLHRSLAQAGGAYK